MQLLSAAREQVMSGCGREVEVPAVEAVSLIEAGPQRIAPVVMATTDGVPVTAAQLEAAEKVRQASMLVQVLPQECQQVMLGFDEESWQVCPVWKKAEFAMRHLTKFSPGTLSGARRALQRLQVWLELRSMPEKARTFRCPGGLLIWFVTDAQAASKSKSGGLTVPMSLRTGLEFARSQCAVPVQSDTPALATIASRPGVPPVPAVSVTVRMLYHFIHCASSTSVSGVVNVYSSLFVLCVFGSLRVRDAQRASLEISRDSRGEIIRGNCFTSKHPKRRAPQAMPFFVPTVEEVFGGWAAPIRRLQRDLPGRDYLFPAVRREKTGGFGGSTVELALVATPAKSEDIISLMRMVLRLPPLSMTEAEARRVTGHSLRHCLPTLARVFGFTLEERNELGRWAAAVQASARRSALPNVYAVEAESVRVLDILRRLLARMHEAVGRFPSGCRDLPPLGGWDLLSRDRAPKGISVAGLEAESESSDPDSGDEI